MISLEERIDESADTDYALSSHMRCSAQTLHLLATKDVESESGWSSGARACFTKIIMVLPRFLRIKQPVLSTVLKKYQTFYVF